MNIVLGMLRGRLWQRNVAAEELLINSVCETFFSPLCELQASRLSSNDNLDEMLVVAREDITGQYKAALGAELAADADSQYSPGLLVRRAKGYGISPLRFRNHAQAVRTLLSGKPGDGATSRCSGQERSLVGDLTRSIWRVILQSPLYLYSTEGVVPDDAVHLFRQVMTSVGALARSLNLGDPKLLPASTIPSLEHQIAQAEGRVVLPIRDATSAPLSYERHSDGRSELECNYARDRQLTQDLAQHIATGEGVVLVAGYRGVGKSTFVNSVLACMRENGMQQDDLHQIVVPIKISLAKARGARQVLRACIRELYDTLSGRPFSGWLQDDERSYLRFAHLRACYKLQQTREESVAMSVESQVELGADLSKVWGKLGLPSLSVKGETAMSTAFDQRIALLDYDEERAEQDLTSLISMLARPRLDRSSRRSAMLSRLRRGYAQELQARAKRIKCVFILDEMDKMSEDDQEEIIRELKNLFLARDAVFLVISSKAFLYRWQQARQHEDAVLASYFSAVVMVPLFTTRETRRLLELICPANLSNREDEFLSLLSRDLTYRSMGLPREIVRELHAMRTWLPGSHQACLAPSAMQLGAMRVYAALQDVVEGISGSGDTDQVGDADSPTIDDSSGDRRMGTPPLRLYRNRGLTEQIQRGCYVLVELLIDRGSIEWNAELLKADSGAVIRRIYEYNFASVPLQDFVRVLDDLSIRLSNVALPWSPELDSVRQTRDSSRTSSLFEREHESETETVRLVVDPLLYAVTGRLASQDSLEPEGIESRLRISLEEAERLIHQGSPLGILQGIHALRRQGKLPESIERGLYDVFSSHHDVTVRLEAGRLLSSSVFLECAAESDFGWLATETHEAILRRIISYSREALERRINVALATDSLLVLLGRNLRPVLSGRPDLQLLPADAQTAVLSALSLSTEENVLERAVASLDPARLVVPASVQALAQLPSGRPETLLKLFVEHDIRHAITPPGWRWITTSSGLDSLWLLLIEHKDNEIAQEAIAEILYVFSTGEVDDRLRTSIWKWISSSAFGAEDRQILSQAGSEPRVYYALDNLVNKGAWLVDDQRTAQARLEGIRHSVEEQRIEEFVPESGTDTPTKEKDDKGRQGRIWQVLAVIGVLTVFVIVPTDLAQDATLLQRFGGRLLEATYMVFLVISLFLILVGATDSDNRNGLISGLICFLVSTGAFAAVFWWMGHPLTVWGQLGLGAILGLAFLMPSLMGKLTARTRPRRES